ncbi:MATE family efflux transporter [Brachybacterium sp. YJGR34]|uniref:MATE family efflux transporter n=1 Tax=Brachybacterium sp. YJGR34 TaxID=2059911 RepID=UPI000E0B8020|nr:MATE family efflux transporter [Brachybacterium sp. YJGR34]
MPVVLTRGAPWRVILLFAVPLLLGNIVQQMYQFADAAVIGRHLGVNSLAAVGATGGLLFLLLGFAIGVSTGFAVPTAQAYGAGDRRGVARSVVAGTILTAAISVVVSVGGALAAGPMLSVLRTPAELLPEATTFARISFLGAGTVMFFNYLAAIIRAIGDSRTPLRYLIIACLLNVVLSIAFVMGAGLGIAGAALSTCIAQLASALLCLAHVRAKVPALHVAREDWRIDRAALAEHLRIGLPMGFQASIIAIGSLAVQIRINTLGPDAVAAYTTYARVDGLGVALLQSLGLAATTFAAQNLGAGKGRRIRRGIVQALGLAVGSSLAIGVVLVLAGRPLVHLFVGEGSEDVVEMAMLPLHINAALYSILGILFVLRGALQGLGQPLVPMLTGVIELAMRLGTAVVLGALFGFAGVVWGTPLAWAGAVALLVPAYVRAHRRLAALPDGPAVTGSFAAVTGQIPAVTGALPTVTGQIPAVTGAIPTITGSFPTVTGPIPVVTGPVPVATEPVPTVTEPVPAVACSSLEVPGPERTAPSTAPEPATVPDTSEVEERTEADLVAVGAAGRRE